MSRSPIRTARRVFARGCMFLATSFARRAPIALVLGAAVFEAIPAFADNGFPFGLEMALDAARQPGSKRIPNMQIGASGQTTLPLSPKGGKAQLSAARH